MKYPTRNNAQNDAKKQDVFEEKMRAKIRMKLRQFAEIEYLNHSQKKLQKSNLEKK